MHVERAEQRQTMFDEVTELARVLSRYRWRLGCEHLVQFGLRGVLGSAAVAVCLSIAAWLMERGLWQSLAWLPALPFVAALVVAALRWPSNRQAALAADRRLDLAERLGTAVEVAARLRDRASGGGRFDALQVQDAIDRARVTPTSWLALDRHTRNEALVASAAVLLAVASLLLPGLPRPSLPADESQTSAGAQAVDALDRTLPYDSHNLEVAEPLAVPQAPADAQLAARIAQQQAQHDALDRLSQALSHVSAGQPAADALQRGDFSGAKQQLATLGEEADQLSDAAKQQLARDLQQAANATAATDRQLADRERQAAQALSRNNYVEQRQALRNLADQVERSGARSASADQLARDVGRLQQQSAQGQGQSARANQGQTQSAPTDQGQSQSTAPGQAGGDAAGQQGGPGSGSGTNADALGNQQSRLDTAGQSVQVPIRLSSGPGVRPTDGTEDQVGNDPTAGARSVSELVQAQQTGQVAPEQNLVPGEQRPVVRGYFR